MAGGIGLQHFETMLMFPHILKKNSSVADPMWGWEGGAGNGLQN